MTWIQFKTQGNTWRSIGGGIQGKEVVKKITYTQHACVSMQAFFGEKKRDERQTSINQSFESLWIRPHHEHPSLPSPYPFPPCSQLPVKQSYRSFCHSDLSWGAISINSRLYPPLQSSIILIQVSEFFHQLPPHPHPLFFLVRRDPF